MNIPELIITEEVLPGVRSNVSRQLRDHGWSQAAIGKVLGISQVMVSKYLKEDLKVNELLSDPVERFSREITAGALSGEDLEQLSARFCSLIDDCMGEGCLSERFRERFGVESNRFCFMRNTSNGNRQKILTDLSSSISMLKGKKIDGLVPALGINIAQSIPSPVTREDVASFPGRINTRGGLVLGAEQPEFGASKHLSKVLMTAVNSHMDIFSAGSVLFDDRIASTLVGKDGYRVLDRNKETIEELISIQGKMCFLADPGDFGVEPCLYIFGHSSLDVAMSILEINRSLNEKETSK